MARFTIQKPASMAADNMHDRPAIIDPKFEERWPIVWAYLFQERYEGGGFRQTGTLLVFLDQGRMKVCLSDREGSRSLFRSAETLDGCLDALEACLVDDSADWKPKKVNPPMR